MQQLVDVAIIRKQPDFNYAGEVFPVEAFDYASANQSVIVDVRTVPEWQFTGTPDLANTPSKLVTLSWRIYPSFALNPKFVDDLAAEPSVTKDTPLFFLCRSGGRSLDAAIAVAAAGYNYCFNIIHGFEGEPDANGHRGNAGWKYDNLPWIQG